MTIGTSFVGKVTSLNTSYSQSWWSLYLFQDPTRCICACVRARVCACVCVCARPNHLPVPKNSDLLLCDNWRGISLLEVVGKVFAKIIQRRLQVLVEDVVADPSVDFDQVVAVLIWFSVHVN